MPTYIDQHQEYDEFDVVKWVHCDPYEAVDSFTGVKKKMHRILFFYRQAKMG